MQINNYLNINQAAEQLLNNKNVQNNKPEQAGMSFQDILKAKALGNEASEISLKFSKHASSRLEERDITMTDEQMARLNEGTARAQ